MNVLDIGANKGLFTDKCLSTYNDVRVVLIEANPFLYKELEKKYENLNNIIVLNRLVSDETNILKDFYISNSDVFSTASINWIKNSRFTKDFKWDEPIQILSISLDELIETYKNFDIIKIDVEGYELEVIKGLSKKHCKICFEWAEEEKEKINLTCNHLQEIGYTEFGYIFKDEYLKEPDLYTTWANSNFNNDINPHRKEKWGMIWAK